MGGQEVGSCLERDVGEALREAEGRSVPEQEGSSEAHSTHRGGGLRKTEPKPSSASPLGKVWRSPSRLSQPSWPRVSGRRGWALQVGKREPAGHQDVAVVPPPSSTSSLAVGLHRNPLLPTELEAECLGWLLPKDWPPKTHHLLLLGGWVDALPGLEQRWFVGGCDPSLAVRGWGGRQERAGCRKALVSP